MTKIYNFALKIKGGGREGDRYEVLRPCRPPPQNLERALGGQGVTVKAVSNSLILGGWVTNVLKNGDKKWGGGGVEGWVTTIFGG